MALRNMLDMVHSIERGETRNAMMNKVHAFALATPGGTKGLRVDLQLLFDDEEFWVDSAATHPTTNSTTSRVTKWVKAHDTANEEAGGLLRLNSMLMEPSPCVATAVNTKHNRYGGLLDVASTQFKAGARATQPVFIAAVTSHTGEMAPELHTLVESITRQYARTITKHDLEDGVSKNRRTGIFRSRFKDALMTAMAEGFGRLLAGAGRVSIPYITRQKGLEGYSAFLPSSSYRG
jgi:hypothetical protein